MGPRWTHQGSKMDTRGNKRVSHNPAGIGPRGAHRRSKMDPRGNQKHNINVFQNGSKWGPIWIKDGSKLDPRWHQKNPMMGPRWTLQGKNPPCPPSKLFNGNRMIGHKMTGWWSMEWHEKCDQGALLQHPVIKPRIHRP